jgi:hypothetical protein
MSESLHRLQSAKRRAQYQYGTSSREYRDASIALQRLVARQAKVYRLTA